MNQVEPVGAPPLERPHPPGSPRDERAMGERLRRLEQIGGGALAGGFVLYLGALVCAPMLAVGAHALSGGLAGAAAAIRDPVAARALTLTLTSALATSVVNLVFGAAVAWALARWQFPGKGLLARGVDLPFAVPTLVAGVLIVALYGPQSLVGGWLGSQGVPLVFARPSILLAMLFVTFPFVVRAVLPVLSELDPAEEEAAQTLGASRWQIFWWVLLPAMAPALGVGTAQVFARCVAEFGAVAVVSGNIPYETLTAPVYILGEVEAGQTHSAAAVSLVLLGVAAALHPITRLIAHTRVGR